MKRVMRLTAAVLVLLFGFVLSGCGSTTIDGAKFRGTKSIIEHKLSAGKDTEDKSDDLYEIEINLTISISISEKDKMITVDEKKFDIKPECVRFELQNQYYTQKETIDVYGPQSEKEESGLFITYIHLSVKYGENNTRETLEALSGKLEVAYDGHKISFVTTYLPVIQKTAENKD